MTAAAAAVALCLTVTGFVVARSNITVPARAATAGKRVSVRLVHIRGQTVPVATSGAAFGLAPFGMSFQQISDASPSVSMAEAVDIAMHNGPAEGSDGGLAPNVDVAAEYGLFSDSEQGTQTAGGKFVLTFQARPAWIVTFTGSGIAIGGDGSSATGAVNHEYSVFVDARTGAFLQLIS